MFRPISMSFIPHFITHTTWVTFRCQRWCSLARLHLLHVPYEDSGSILEKAHWADPIETRPDKWILLYTSNWDPSNWCCSSLIHVCCLHEGAGSTMLSGTRQFLVYGRVSGSVGPWSVYSTLQFIIQTVNTSLYKHELPWPMGGTLKLQNVLRGVTHIHPHIWVLDAKHVF